MVAVQYRTFRTRGVFSNKQAFRREIENAMTGRVVPLVTSDLQDIAQDLNLPLTFDPQVKIDEDGISLNFAPQGPRKVVGIWYAVSGGTKRHAIPTKPRPTRRGVGNYKPALFLARYAPRTSPTLRGSYGGPGQYISNPVYRHHVMHPGIKPRYFERSVAYNVRKDFYKIMENALRRAVRAAQKEGT